jgi:hypothetical protein
MHLSCPSSPVTNTSFHSLQTEPPTDGTFQWPTGGSCCTEMYTQRVPPVTFKGTSVLNEMLYVLPDTNTCGHIQGPHPAFITTLVWSERSSSRFCSRKSASGSDIGASGLNWKFLSLPDIELRPPSKFTELLRLVWVYWRRGNSQRASVFITNNRLWLCYYVARSQ